MIDNIRKTIKNFDIELYNHCTRTSNLAVAIGQHLIDDISSLQSASLVHDVGKLFIDKQILNKKGALSYEERCLIDYHSVWGYSYLRYNGIKIDICEIVLLHHGKFKEKYNYTYTPENAYIAEILRAADIIDAMTSKRPYHDPADLTDVINVLQKLSEPLPATILKEIDCIMSHTLLVVS